MDNNGKSEKLRYKIFHHVNVVRDVAGEVHELPGKLIVTYSDRWAKKDRADRERLIKKAKKLEEEPGKINASIWRQFLLQYNLKLVNSPVLTWQNRYGDTRVNYMRISSFQSMILTF